MQYFEAHLEILLIFRGTLLQINEHNQLTSAVATDFNPTVGRSEVLERALHGVPRELRAVHAGDAPRSAYAGRIP